MTFPRHGPVERYAQLRAVLEKQAFFEQFPGVGALIRLDERGGTDEPAPWAFHGAGVSLPVEVPSSDEDVFVDPRPPPSAGADEPTMTGPTLSLSIPAARARATLLVVPRTPSVVVGRDPGADIVIEERSVSKRHAEFIAEGSTTWQVADLRSANGLAVNGRRVQQGGRTKLSSGDVVDLGDVSVLFLDVAGLWDSLPRLAGD